MSSSCQQALEELEQLVSHLQVFKIREQVKLMTLPPSHPLSPLLPSSFLFQIFLNPGLVLNHTYFGGLVFRFVLSLSSRQQQRSPRLRTAAVGGVYDHLLSYMRTVTDSMSVGAGPPSTTPTSIVGVAMTEDIITNRVAAAFMDGQVSRFDTITCT